MDCFQIYMEEIAQRIKSGDKIERFTKQELLKVQQYALSTSDMELAHKIEEYLKSI